MLDKISKLFRFRPKKFLGIDIGTSFIRIIELSSQGQGFRLENYGEAGISSFNNRPFRVFKKNTLSLSNKEVAKAIQTIIQEAEIETKEFAFAIPDFCSFFTNVELPVMDKDEVPQAVKYQARPYIPLPLDDVTLDWSIIEGEFSKTPLKILVVAIHNDVISQYQEIAELAALKLKFLEPEVFALAKASVKNKKEDKITGLIDIGARSTTCSVLEKGILKISHSFNVAGQELTGVIARSLNIEYNKAEEVKREKGLLSEELRKLLLPLVGSILEETKKAFRNFYLQEGKEIEKVVLAGGLSLMPGLKEFFAAELKKEIIIADPFSGIASPPILTETLKEIGPYYGISIGLALKGLE